MKNNEKNTLKTVQPSNNLLVNSTNNIFAIEEIKDEQTALNALRFSGSFLTLTAWLRAKQFSVIAKYIKKADILLHCESINRSQLFTDIKVGKYLIFVDNQLQTIFDDIENEKKFNPRKYTNFCAFVEHIESVASIYIKELSEVDKLSLIKKFDCNTTDELKFKYAIKVGKDLLKNDSIYDTELKTLKTLLSGKELKADEKQADEKQADEKQAESLPIKQFKKFLKTTDKVVLLDIALAFVEYVKTL